MCSPTVHLFSLYTWELTFGQTIPNTEVLLGTPSGTAWEIGEPHGEGCEYMGLEW
jgi:hypothetical protein